MSLHTGKGRTVGKAIRDIIGYVENPEKTDGGRLISSFQCDSRVADAEFLLSKRQYQARTGRRRGADDVIAYTIRQSFAPGEITPEEANRLGYELAIRFTKGKHAFIVCTHVDKAHIHNHIIWNSTSLDHSRKFRDFFGSGKAVRRLNDTIAVLKTHIINYSKTRAVYIAYRKAGYSKKFLAEHEGDIILHRAAKKAFDELGVKKIPTVKSLQTEYAKLLAEKRAAYSEYRTARDEMRELLAVKANVDRIMGEDQRDKATEKEHDQR